MRDLGERVTRLEQGAQGGFVAIWRGLGETEEQATKRWKSAHPDRASDAERRGAKICVVSWLQ